MDSSVTAYSLSVRVTALFDIASTSCGVWNGSIRKFCTGGRAMTAPEGLCIFWRGYKYSYIGGGAGHPLATCTIYASRLPQPHAHSLSAASNARTCMLMGVQPSSLNSTQASWLQCLGAAASPDPSTCWDCGTRLAHPTSIARPTSPSACSH